MHAWRLMCGSLILILLLAACGRGPSASGSGTAAKAITAGPLLEDIRVLASDEFEGRLPGTPGEDKTVALLTERFKSLGLAPGNPDGSYVQTVPLVGIRSEPQLTLQAGDQTLRPAYRSQYMAASERVVPDVAVQDSELVFVGYGAVAPEYGWDDYKGLDVTGKTLVMLVNDPGFATRDPALFRGRTMTFYGRWTYKYQIGSEKGAAAVLVVHDTDAAGYPWTVVDNSWGSENFYIRSADGNAGRIALSGWITGDYARELFSAAGQDFEALKTAASRRDFKPVALGKASFKVRNSTREVDSRNVIARLPGRERPDEHIVYTAHWDHLGRDGNLEGDQIYNGALDNATGTAGLIALARAYKALPQPPRRSVLFLAVTAEEQGLLGAQRYAASPLYPLEQTLANFNMDALNPWGRTRDVEVIGWGQSTLEDLLREEAGKQGRVLAPEAEPEKGYYYRSDHFEFAKRGVPALYAKSGIEFIGQPPDYGERRRAEYRAKAYHGVADEVQPDWDLSGMVEDLQLYFAVGHRVTEADARPQWKEGSEFRAIREAQLAQ